MSVIGTGSKEIEISIRKIEEELKQIDERWKEAMERVGNSTGVAAGCSPVRKIRRACLELDRVVAITRENETLFERRRKEVRS